MALREHSRPVAAGRTGRHGRPRPFGGRLRLPTIRFSGAAMAMSTVVGISLATTWLLNEQQQIGRRPGVTVGGPPAPSPDPSEPAPEATPVEGPATTQAAPLPGRASTSPTARPGTRPAAVTATPVTTASASSPAAPSTTPAPSPLPTGPAAPSPSASGTGTPLAPTPSPSATPRPDLQPPVPSSSPAPTHPLGGTARVDALGRAGTRHTVQVRLDESMTALQVEFRLARPAALPGTAPRPTCRVRSSPSPWNATP
ncbi:hypothetical protein [Kitasatospora cheerisanensis]|uniref:Uncharacterized protein n=1 Tax=Kitasatospora cheerisanensis KCTC 2395 TaxID=1348663 RepID=A0A066YXB0_9ACTN|nr:hypothetical protein [Kitasatospora cheerisanensis]KDN82696.1 hypothetical protein KCH_56110 [Kitasatospora cheerisanensis KCTC 2395]